jgi:phosphoribosylformylglycinamidine (FGAM) synthase PurS component
MAKKIMKATVKVIAPKKKMGGSKPLTKAQDGAVMLSITDPKERMRMAIGDSTRAAKQIELANNSTKLKRKQKKEIKDLNEPRLHSPAIERYTQKMEKLNSKKK